MSTRALRNREHAISTAASVFEGGKSSTILVSGPDALTALLWLCRHGYEHAGLTRLGSGPREACDVLFAAGCCTPNDLDDVLVSKAWRLAPHGQLVVDYPRRDADGFASVLDRHGFTAERCMADDAPTIACASRANEPLAAFAKAA